MIIIILCFAYAVAVSSFWAWYDTGNIEVLIMPVVVYLAVAVGILAIINAQLQKIARTLQAQQKLPDQDSSAPTKTAS